MWDLLFGDWGLEYCSLKIWAWCFGLGILILVFRVWNFRVWEFDFCVLGLGFGDLEFGILSLDF